MILVNSNNTDSIGNKQATTTTIMDVIKSMAPLANSSAISTSTLTVDSPALIPISNPDGSEILTTIDFYQSNNDPVSIAAHVDRFISTNFSVESGSSNRIILAPADNPQYSLLAASWSSYSGDPLLFINSDSIPDETLQRLETKKGGIQEQNNIQENNTQNTVWTIHLHYWTI